MPAIPSPSYHPSYDMLSPALLGELFEAAVFPAVSIYLPTVVLGRDRQQNPIRYRATLNEAEERLRAEHRLSADIRKMLEPAKDLVSRHAFWERPGESLAVFIAPGFFRHLWLPFSVENVTLVSHGFYLKPLLAYFTESGRFHILALSQKHSAFYMATKLSISEVRVADMPRSINEVLGGARVEQSIQPHSVTAGASVVPMFHGQYSIKEDEKEDVQKFFREIEKALRSLLARESAPLVVAGVERYLPLYQEINTYPHLLPAGVTGNVDTLAENSLHALAWTVVEPYFHEHVREVRDHFLEVQGTEPTRTTFNLQEIAAKAVAGKVEELLLVQGAEVWGYFDPVGGSLTLLSQEEVGSSGLLDFAALQTIGHGSQVAVLTQEEMPVKEKAAAILRY